MLLNKIEFFLMNNPLRGYLQSFIEIPRIISFSTVPVNGRVLEIGCGSGRGTQLIQKHFQPAEITGIDLDPKMIEIATHKHYDGKVDFQVADVTNLPFKNNTFDVIFDFGIIHHVPNWKKAVEHIVRVTKPGGLLVLEDLSIETFRNPLGRLARTFLAHPYSEMYAQNEFVHYLEKCGTEILAEKTFTNVGTIRYFTVVARKK